jgi:Ca-activated chloride channel family protein
VIRLDTALVGVPVIVTDRWGRLVTGLREQDFVLRENGETQEIASFSSTEAPFDVALLIDTSRSTRNKMNVIRRAALDFVRKLKPQDRVLIVTFDEKVNFLGDFTSDRRQLSRTIRSVKSSYLTSLYDAIHITINEKLVPVRGRKAIVVLTDGVDTYSRRATYESTLELVANTGVLTYAVQYETRNIGGPTIKPPSIPPYSSRFFATPFAAAAPQIQHPPKRDRYIIATEYLQSLAAHSGARYMRAETIESTSYAFGLIAEELRNQYTLAYYSTNEKRDGTYRRIDVRVGAGDLTARWRPGYRAVMLGEAEQR